LTQVRIQILFGRYLHRYRKQKFIWMVLEDEVFISEKWFFQNVSDLCFLKGMMNGVVRSFIMPFLPWPGLPDFSWHNIPRRGKINQIAT
jgi:hypothetical protein